MADKVEITVTAEIMKMWRSEKLQVSPDTSIARLKEAALDAKLFGPNSFKADQLKLFCKETEITSDAQLQAKLKTERTFDLRPV